MALQGSGRVFRSGEANTLYVSIPATVVTDSAFPFEESESVTVHVKGDGLRITSADD